MPLHPDVLSFLEKRNGFRDELAEALRGNTEDDDDTSAEDAGAVVGANPGGKADECAVPARGQEGSGSEGTGRESCTNVTDALAKVTKIESFRHANGWPDSGQLYADLINLLKSAPDETATMEQVIEWQRQISVLESYRKMLLHKKQGACEYLTSWCRCMESEEQSQQELEALMLNRSVGLTAESGGG